MSLTIETDLRDILNKLDQRFERMEQRFERMEQNLVDLKVGQAKIDGEIKTINTKIDGIQKTTDKLCIDVADSSKEVSDLKGAKSLIIPGFVAILASFLTFIFRNISL